MLGEVHAVKTKSLIRFRSIGSGLFMVMIPFLDKNKMCRFLADSSSEIHLELK